MKNIVAINASPRGGWNTATLVKEAARGAENEGAKVTYFDLYKLEKFTGCISCFGCKLPPNQGKCVYHDALYDVLEAIRNSDGLIVGTPNYLGDVSSAFRALYERLIFQVITYKKENWSYNTRHIPVLFIMTSNVSSDAYEEGGMYEKMLSGYKSSLDYQVGKTKVLVSGNTLQVDNYDISNWSAFNPDEKKEYHINNFPKDKEKAFLLGSEMVTFPW